MVNWVSTPNPQALPIARIAGRMNGRALVRLVPNSVR